MSTPAPSEPERSPTAASALDPTTGSGTADGLGGDPGGTTGEVDGATEPADDTLDADADADADAGAGADGGERRGGFSVRLDNFEGPFDLLLQLISKHKLDVTEVALSRVTDEFIAHIRAMGSEWDLDEASEFLIIAATLLDLKAARLLPSAQVEDEEDLALLEARDLLFARLLQYKAFKQAAAHLDELEKSAARRYPRTVGLEPRYAEVLPEIVLSIGLDRFAQLAVRGMTPKAPPTVTIDHVHMVRVSVREHAAILAERLQRIGTGTFRALCSDCANTLEMVARFLALLEMYRENMVGFEQLEALGELTVRWQGGDGAATLDVDEYAGTPPAADPASGDAGGPAGDTDEAQPQQQRGRAARDRQRRRPGARRRVVAGRPGGRVDPAVGPPGTRRRRRGR
ncbi:segregation and condensation protein A [Actinocatenispora thailandica]|uniref:segregation and condensation protein A n=1 Tax=Actinocatenispora thailandica TaxID=227318 RepID=UPI003B838FC9